MKVVSILALLVAAATATEVSVVCEAGRTLQVGYSTEAGPRSASIDLEELKSHSLEGANVTYTVRCPVGSVHKPMRTDGQVNPKKVCGDCSMAILTSATPAGIPVTAAVIKKGTVVKMKTPIGGETTSEPIIHARAAKIAANLRATQKVAGYFETALGAISHSTEGGTPMRGSIHSGLADVVENRWKPGATGSVTLDAQTEPADNGFLVQMSADFGASPTGLALSIKDAAGAEILPAAVRTGGAESKVAFTSPPRLVHKICPFVVQTKKLDLSLTAPSNNPKAILDKMIYSKLGSANADPSYPEGLRFAYQLISVDDITNLGLTVDEVNKIPSSLTADKKEKALALLSAYAGADASEPCLDIMSGATPVKRNWPNTFDVNCRDKDTELSADSFFTGCYDCAGCKALGTAASTAQDKKDLYAAKCPMWGLGLVDEAGLKAQAGWGSDKANLAHANTYCQYNDDYKAEADTVTAAPSGYTTMSSAQCKNFAEAYTSVTGFSGGSITWGTTETDAAWPKGCYINHDGKVYHNGHATGAAKTGAQRVHISFGLVYGATYRQFAGATCHKCYVSPSGRRSAEPLEMAAVSTANKKEGTGAPRALLDAYERGHISRAKDHADALAANAAYAKSGKSSSRRMLSTGIYTPPTSASGGACKSNGNFALESSCGGGCAFQLNSGWCEATGSQPWKGKAGCYDRGAHNGCKQAYCRIGTSESKTVNDAALSEDHSVTTYCQDACKGFTGLPYKWTNEAGWLSPTGQAVTETQYQAACSANGPTCQFLRLGRCFDAYGSYFAARAAGALMTHGLTELRTDAQVDLARQKGIVCPNELAHECGLYDLKGTFDLPASVNATEWAAQRTCEALPLIDPNSASNINETLSTFTHDADVNTRYAQVQKLGCLSFNQCDWSAARGCFTKPGHAGDCVEDFKTTMHCAQLTDAAKKATCEASAKQVCDNLRDEESIIRQILPLGNKLVGARNVKGLGIKAMNFMQTMQQVRDSLMSDALDEESVLSTKLNLAAQVAQFAVCKAKIGAYGDDSAVTTATLHDYHLKKAATDSCMAKLLAYTEAKVVQQFNVASRTAGDTVAKIVEDNAIEYIQTPRSAVQAAARIDICTGQSENAGLETVATDFGGADADASDQPVCLQKALKTFVSLESMLLRMINPTAGNDMKNQLVLVAGDVTFEPNLETSPCVQAAAAPAGFSHTLLGCPSGSRRGLSVYPSRTFRFSGFSKGRYYLRGGAGSRRSGDAATEQASCPPGTTANGTHSGPRCWNAYTNANLYFPSGYTMTSTDWRGAERQQQRRRGLHRDAAVPQRHAVPGGTSPTAADDVIYWRDPNDANQWLTPPPSAFPTRPPPPTMPSTPARPRRRSVGSAP